MNTTEGGRAVEKRRQERVRLEDLGELVSVERLRKVFDPPLGRRPAYELAHQLNPGTDWAPGVRPAGWRRAATARRAGA